MNIRNILILLTLVGTVGISIGGINPIECTAFILITWAIIGVMCLNDRYEKELEMQVKALSFTLNNLIETNDALTLQNKRLIKATDPTKTRWVKYDVENNPGINQSQIILVTYPETKSNRVKRN